MSQENNAKLADMRMAQLLDERYKSLVAMDLTEKYLTEVYDEEENRSYYDIGELLDATREALSETDKALRYAMELLRACGHIDYLAEYWKMLYQKPDSE